MAFTSGIASASMAATRRGGAEGDGADKGYMRHAAASGGSGGRRRRQAAGAAIALSAERIGSRDRRCSPTSSRMVWMVLSACDCRYCCCAFSGESAVAAMASQEHSDSVHQRGGRAQRHPTSTSPSPLAGCSTKSASKLFRDFMTPSDIASDYRQ